GHRATRADPGHHVDVRRLQHGGAAGGHPRHPDGLPGGGQHRRRPRLAAHRAHRDPAAASHHREPGHPRLHRQDEAVRPGVGDDPGRPHVGHRDGGHLRGQARVRVEDARSRLSLGHRRHLVRHHLRTLAAPHSRAAAPRGAGVLSVRRLGRLLLLLPVLPSTASSAGPYVWTAMMSLRTTEEIYRSHYAPPIPAHWPKFATAWNEFGYATYFKNSLIVAVASVLIVTLIGA